MDSLLSTIEPFNSLPQEITAELSARCVEVDLSPEQVLFRQGDPGDCLYVVIDGAVSVFSESEDGGQRELSRLERGAVFGEMALLTGQPRSASVRAATPVRLTAIRKTEFDRVVTAHPELVVALARTLSERLNRRTVDLSRAEASEKAYQRLLSEYYAGPQVPLVGRTKVMTELMARADKMAGSSQPVLIAGAPGTEKRSVAWRIHQVSERRTGPFVVFDPHQVQLGDTRDFPLSGGVVSELAQDAVLFGCPPGLLSSMKSGRMGLLQAADAGTLVIDNLDTLEPAVQEKLAGYLQTGTFSLPDGQSRRSTARIVGILSTALPSDPGRLSPPAYFAERRLVPGSDSAARAVSVQGLADAFSKNQLSVPPLVRRKKDLGLILDSMVESLGKRLGKKITGVEQDAYQAVLAYDWPGNVEELEIVVKRAIKLTETDAIRGQDVFIGVDEQAGPTVDLLKQPLVKTFFLSPWLSALPALAGFALLLVVLFSVTGLWAAGRDLALIAVWGIGEPLFLISALGTARFGCSCCPFGRLASMLSAIGLRRDPPNWMRRYGVHIGATGLGIILWAQVATGMTYSSRATVVLVLSILFLALVGGAIFKRRTWCRFVCPLGNWVGAVATCSAVELRGKTAVCNSDCTSHACHKGTSDHHGCQMFEGPFALKENSECILCGDCIKLCPNNSPLVNLRLPGRELWSNRKLSTALPAFIPVMVATQLLRLSDHAGLLDALNTLPSSALLLAALTVLLWAGTVGAAIGAARISARGSDEESGGPDGARASVWSSRAAVLVGATPLVVSCEIAYQLSALLGRGPDALGILGRLTGWDQMAGLVFLPWQVKAVELGALTAGLGMTLVVEKLGEDPRLRIPGTVAVLLLYIVFVGLVLLG